MFSDESSVVYIVVVVFQLAPRGALGTRQPRNSSSTVKYSSLWVAVDCIGSLKVVVGRFGWFRVLVTTHQKCTKQAGWDGAGVAYIVGFFCVSELVI